MSNGRRDIRGWRRYIMNVPASTRVHGDANAASVLQPEKPAAHAQRSLPSLVGNRAMARALASPGAPLPNEVRNRLERAFGSFSAPAPVRDGIGDSRSADEQQAREWSSLASSSSAGQARADFSNVRVHAGSDAAASAAELGAHAYTTGSDIVLGEGAANERVLAHELTHVLQQAHSDARAVQLDRAANCPASAPGTQTILTTQDFIELVRRVERDNPTIATNAVAMARLIARTKYAGRMWDWMLPSTAGQAGVQQGPNVSADDLGSLCFKLVVTMPGGGQEDPMHLIAAITANAETRPAGSASGVLVNLALSALPSNVTQRDASTWVGDVGSAAAEWMDVMPLRSGSASNNKTDYMSEHAPPHELMANVDGVALTSTSAPRGFAFNPNEALSTNLERFYLPSAPREGRHRRFHIFCGVEGFGLQPDGITLSAAARTTIRSKVENFAFWYRNNNPAHTSQRASHQLQGQGMPSPVFMQMLARANDHVWFADQFIDFVQNGLTTEGP